MQVVAKKPRIDVNITGKGARRVIALVRKEIPDARIVDDPPQDIEEWDYFQRIRARLTPGNVLKIRRENAGLSQAALARKCGIAASNISQMESGKRGIGAKSAQKLSKALKCSAEDFIR